jgi:hypothetical protein
VPQNHSSFSLVYCCFSTFPSLNLHISHDMSYSCIMGGKEAKVRWQQWQQLPSCTIFAVTWWNDRNGRRAIEMFWLLEQHARIRETSN